MNDLVNKQTSIIEDNSVYFGSKSKKIEVLVNALRLVSSDEDIKKEKLLIPNDCKKYGFVEGYHNLSIFLHFLADMLEE